MRPTPRRPNRYDKVGTLIDDLRYISRRPDDSRRNTRILALIRWVTMLADLADAISDAANGYVFEATRLEDAKDPNTRRLHKTQREIRRDVAERSKELHDLLKQLEMLLLRQY